MALAVRPLLRRWLGFMHCSALSAPITITLLLPPFFAFTGLRTAIQLISGAGLWFYCVAIIATAIVGKLLGCALTLRAGTLVNTRGLIEQVIAIVNHAETGRRRWV
jgi:Kef-type K+ transport system membrane component KefB